MCETFNDKNCLDLNKHSNGCFYKGKIVCHVGLLFIRLTHVQACLFGVANGALIYHTAFISQFI